MIELKFLGATGTVTGSRTLFSTDATRLLVDCGLFQGYKQLRLRNWERFPVDVRSLAGVLLTHAHIDHSGYLPLLVRQGFSGPIHATAATFELCRILLPDAGRLQEEEAAHANRSGWSKHRPALPLYTERDALASLERFEVHPFDAPFSPMQGTQATFLRAGHILGSAMIRLVAGSVSTVFSGDLGRPHDAIMRAPDAIEPADHLVLESTYGNRRHDTADPLEQLGAIVRRTAARGGVVVIPSFAVGRAQTLLYTLHRLRESGRIPSTLPIYLNSPMAQDVTAIYRRHRSEHRLSPDECAGLCRVAHIVNSVPESISLNEQKGPMVIIAGSGMATGGRVVHHLKAFAPDPLNTIVFAGFQAGGTRGAAILAGAPAVKIHGEYVPMRAQIERLDNLSAHADAGETLDWLRALRAPPRAVLLNHGEPEAADALRLKIQEELHWPVSVPAYLDTTVLG